MTLCIVASLAIIGFLISYSKDFIDFRKNQHFKVLNDDLEYLETRLDSLAVTINLINEEQIEIDEKTQKADSARLR